MYIYIYIYRYRYIYIYRGWQKETDKKKKAYYVNHVTKVVLYIHNTHIHIHTHTHTHTYTYFVGALVYLPRQCPSIFTI
jgi:hypothetical protein